MNVASRQCSYCLEPAVPLVPGLPSLNVALRTLVSFEGNFPKTSTVPGREIADLLTERLRAAGFDVADPEKLTGYVWLVGGRFPVGQVASVVGLTDDPPIEWQVHTYPPRIRPRWLGGPRRDELEATVRTWCQAIHDVLTSDDRIRTVRWYEQEAFDRDHGATWAGTPA